MYSGPQMHCEVRKVVPGSQIPPYWDWVKSANYTGKEVIEGETLDRWLLIVSL